MKSIDQSNFCKLNHFDKLSFWSTINWPIEVGNFCNFKNPPNEGFGMHAISQYVSTFCKLKHHERINF